MSENNINVGGRLHSIATGNVLAGSNEILDDALGKKQSQVNVETYALVESVNNALASLSPEQQGALDVSEKANNNEVKLGYYVCQTEGNVAAKTIAAANYVLGAGGSIKIKMNNANTVDNATLNINSTGAKALYYAGERASATNSWEAGETVEVYYDGTSFYANNVAGGSGSGDGAFDISAKTGDTYETLSAALTAANSILSAGKKKGGMSIKFIQLTPATYNVVKTEGVETQPTGTEVQEALSLESGTYTAAQMTGVTPPASGSVTYYLAVTVDETTTYTTWVITKATSDVQKYVQYRLMLSTFTDSQFTNANNWQGVCNELAFNSKDLPTSDTVEKGFWVGEPDTVIDLSNYTEIAYFISGENKWVSTQNYKCKLVPITGGQRYVVKNSDAVPIYYALLTTNSHTANTNASYATGCGRVAVSAGDENNVLAPDNARYMFVSTFMTPNVLNPLVAQFNKHDIRTIDNVPTEGSVNPVSSGGVVSVYGKYIDNTEFLRVYLDNEDKVLWAIKRDGSIYYGAGVPRQVIEYVEKSIVDGSIYNALSTKVDKVPGKSLIDESVAENTYITDDAAYAKLILDEDKRILFGIKKDGDTVFGKMPSQIQAEFDKLFGFHGGIYAYPSRIITGKYYYWFKESVFSGLKPTENYQVYSSVREQNYSKRTIRFTANAAGSHQITFNVKDEHYLTIAKKTITLTARTAPNEKLANSEAIDVFFLGDSMIGNNDNLIGREFVRMLATDEDASTDSTGAKKLAALNVCPNKINLVGEMERFGGHYQYAYRLDDIFVNKRDLPYGDPEATQSYFQQSHNPFYNPDSTEPDNLDADGMNKRVDFVWYFRNACGEGKYPKLIYICISANDTIEDLNLTSNYAVSAAPFFELIQHRMVILCKRLKEACDTIAGGESGTVIKVFNHQTHEIYTYGNAFSGRLMYNLRYNYIYEGIKDASNGISSYVDFVDCASHFDPVNSYSTKVIDTINSRTTQQNDVTYVDPIHMNNVGAYNYADILIDDFLVDERFD